MVAAHDLAIDNDAAANPSAQRDKYGIARNGTFSAHPNLTDGSSVSVVNQCHGQTRSLTQNIAERHVAPS